MGRIYEDVQLICAQRLESEERFGEHAKRFEWLWAVIT
jgi:hypothetical protein